NAPPIFEDKAVHVADMFQRVVAGIQSPASLTHDAPVVTEETAPLGKLASKKADQPTVALFIDAPVPERVWPPERFGEVADFAMEKLGAAVVVICSGEHAYLANRVRE